MRPLAALLCACVLILLTPAKATPNDGAAEAAAGGVRLRNERRVAMKRERLFISPTKVTVEYEFVNESAEDVVTEVAFPVPEYGWSPVDGYHDFKGFKAWVNDVDIPVDTEVRAFADGKDVTAALIAAGLDVESFGRQDSYRIEPDGRKWWVKGDSQVAKLPAPKLEELVRSKLLDPDDHFPLWSVRVTYHWLQHFPPGQVVRVRHAYRPGTGFQLGIRPEYLRDACVDSGLRRALSGELHSSGAAGSNAAWVKYILTTANTWKTPISEFELIVERPADELVSFCWDGRVEKLNTTSFRAKLRDFVPKGELTVFFFSAGKSAPGAAPGAR